MVFRRCGSIRPLRPGELEEAIAEAKKREAVEGSRCVPFQTEEEQFDYILGKINYNPAASVDFGSYEKMGRFYRYWSEKVDAARQMEGNRRLDSKMI